MFKTIVTLRTAKKDILWTSVTLTVRASDIPSVSCDGIPAWEYGKNRCHWDGSENSSRILCVVIIPADSSSGVAESLIRYFLQHGSENYWQMFKFPARGLWRLLQRPYHHQTGTLDALSCCFCARRALVNALFGCGQAWVWDKFVTDVEF